jgi:hypothetical protein
MGGMSQASVGRASVCGPPHSGRGMAASRISYSLKSALPRTNQGSGKAAAHRAWPAIRVASLRMMLTGDFRPTVADVEACGRTAPL